MVCTRCGKEIDDNDISCGYCRKCNEPLDETQF